MNCVIQTSGLSKSFGSFHAVRGIDLQVPAGTVTGFLGQNGAGKSTTIKMLLGMIRPDRGTGNIFGLPISDENASLEIRRQTGFVAEDKRLYPFMSVAEIIRFTASLFPQWDMERERNLLSLFALPQTKKVKQLSKGMRTKLALLLAFCRSPRLLILDEPTEGLDPLSCEQVLQIIVGMAADGVSVFFSSHDISEVEQIAERVVMIDKGRVTLEASLEDLRTKFRRIELVFADPKPIDAFGNTGAVFTHVQGRSVSLLVSHDAERTLERLDSLQPISSAVETVTLKDIFLDSLRAEL